MDLTHGCATVRKLNEPRARELVSLKRKSDAARDSNIAYGVNPVCRDGQRTRQSDP